jgi:predicted RNA-binding Zn ribbon-like protein
VWTGARLERAFWPAAHAALDLLRDGDLDRLAECGRCRWLFLDHSRNHSRRWCSMDACGGVVKMRRHRARRK